MESERFGVSFVGSGAAACLYAEVAPALCIQCANDDCGHQNCGNKTVVGQCVREDGPSQATMATDSRGNTMVAGEQQTQQRIQHV